MMKRKKTIINTFLLVFGLLISCVSPSESSIKNDDDKKAKQADISPVLIETEAEEIREENFQEFYEKFNGDLDFQNSRINYPLKGEFYDGTMDPMDDIDYSWTLEDKLDFDLSDLKENLVRKRDVKPNLIKEEIYVENSGFKIELHFSRISTEGKWFLIYYSYVDA